MPSYYYVDISISWTYQYATILGDIRSMAVQRSRKTKDALGAERLLQAKLPAHLVKALRILALEQDTTVKELLTRLVEEYVAQQRRVPGGRG
jgi:hypothetical protein